MTAETIRVAPRLTFSDYPQKRIELSEAERHQLDNFHHLIADWVVDLLRNEDAEDLRHNRDGYPPTRQPAIERLCNTLLLGRGLYLDPREEDQFSMSQFLLLKEPADTHVILREFVDKGWFEEHKCHAVGCALGYGPWYTGVPKPNKASWGTYEQNSFVCCVAGDRIGKSSVDIDTTLLWFDANWTEHDNTAKGAGARILYGLSHELEDLRPLFCDVQGFDEDGEEIGVERRFLHTYDFDDRLLSPELDPFVLASAVLKARVT